MPVKELVEELLFKYRKQLLVLFIGLILLGLGVFSSLNKAAPTVEILSATDEINSEKIVIEISGAVQESGVYEFKSGDRVDDAIKKAGGLAQNADIEWISRFLNKAAMLTDSQKIFIPSINQSDNESASNFNAINANNLNKNSNVESNPNYININTASKSELESLWGIGPVYAQNIIDQRPYSSVDELIEKKVVKQNVYNRNKNIMTVY